MFGRSAAETKSNPSHGVFLTVRLPAAGVYRRPSAGRPTVIAVAVAAVARGHSTPMAAATAIVSTISAETGASAVALVTDRGPLAIHSRGHAIGPLSPEAAAALQADPSSTQVIDVPVSAIPTPVRLVVVASTHGDLAGIGETVGLALDLAAANEQAARAERLAALKSDFAAVAGHEIRSPLTSIIGALQTIERLGTADATTLELVRGASTRASRLRVLVEDLLMTARIDGHGVPVRARLSSVLDAVIEVVEPHGITVTTSGAPSSVITDGDHVRRILTNLIENAVVHGGGPPIDVSVTGLASGIEVTVSDHGPGLPPEVAGDPFGGSHDSTTGLGLGLKIAAGLTEAIGASLAHHRTPGGGATFTLVLPPSI